LNDETEIDTENKMYEKWDLIMRYALPRMWFAPNQFRNSLIDDIGQLQMHMYKYDLKNFSKYAKKIEKTLNEGRFTTVLSLFIDAYEETQKLHGMEIEDLRNRIDFLEKQLNELNGNNSVTNIITQYTEEGKLIKEKTCLICKDNFKSNRKDSMYCSFKCKQAAYRARKKIQPNITTHTAESQIKNF
jgi:hypothetical protein